MTAGYLNEKKLNAILNAMIPENRLALEVSLETGLRLSDVLRLQFYDLWRGRTFMLTESKTGKKRKISISESLRSRLLEITGGDFVFQAQFKQDEHRTRQAVWKDIKKACKKCGISPRRISPHSMRKTYAVREFKRTGSLKTVQELLNHSSQYTTAIYAFSDKIRK